MKISRDNHSFIEIGGSAEIKTYFYSNGNKHYVEYEFSVLTNGIIQYQSASIW